MALTKIYRLIWDAATKQLLFDPYIEWGDTSTHVGIGRGFFETNDIAEVETKIAEEGLIWH